MAGDVSFLHGPYLAPSCVVGDWLICKMRGEVCVAGWTGAPISWPLGIPHGGTARSFVVCGDLVRAVQVESAQAVRHHWGVDGKIVTRWRKFLGVERFNEGTSRLWDHLAPEKLTEEARAIAVKAQGRDGPGRDWSAEEDRLLFALSIEEVVARLGRTYKSVCKRRHVLGKKLAIQLDRGWTVEELALLGTALDAEIAARIGRTRHAVRIMRIRQGIATARDGRRRNTEDWP